MWAGAVSCFCPASSWPWCWPRSTGRRIHILALWLKGIRVYLSEYVFNILLPQKRKEDFLFSLEWKGGLGRRKAICTGSVQRKCEKNNHHPAAVLVYVCIFSWTKKTHSFSVAWQTKVDFKISLLIFLVYVFIYLFIIHIGVKWCGGERHETRKKRNTRVLVYYYLSSTCIATDVYINIF